MGKPRKISRSAGFTLVELAVVVAVIALMLGSILVPLAAQVDQRNVAETQKRMEEIKDALLGYAMANGRFPCPAAPHTVPLDKGVESFAPGKSAIDGTCAHFYDGFVPGITLGLGNVDEFGYVLDAWGFESNRIRYAVADPTINTVNHIYTRTSGMRNAGLTALGNTVPKLISVCAGSVGAGAGDCGTEQTLADGNAVVVVFSLGKNGSTPFGELSPDEQANQGIPGKQVFTSRTNSASSGTEFDDLVTWISRNAMFSRMVAAGQLP